MLARHITHTPKWKQICREFDKLIKEQSKIIAIINKYKSEKPTTNTPIK